MEKSELTLVSFGYRFGIPQGDIDLIIDVRKGVFNPFHVAGEKTGLDPEISEIVLKNGGEMKAAEIYNMITAIHTNNGANQYKVAVGCIGGLKFRMCLLN